MKILSLMRHAKSSWEFSELTDFDRPLLEKGIQRTQLTCSFLKEMNQIPQLILSSRAVRAKETALLIKDFFNMETEPLWIEDFYPGSISGFKKQLTYVDYKYEHLLFIGHNPGISDFACQILGNQTANWIPTSGCVTLELGIKHWNEPVSGKGRILHYIKPKELKKRNL